MDVLRQDLRYALRSLLAQRSFTIVATLTLALGIGATTSIFSVVRGILLRPLPFGGADRIVSVWQGDPEGASDEGGLLSHPNLVDVQESGRTLESVAQYVGTNLTVSLDGGAELVRGGRVTPAFFRVFGARLQLGREFTDEEDRHLGPAVAILGEGYWRDRLGGQPDVLGSTVRIDGRMHTVVGIAQAGFSWPDGAQIWVPSQNDEQGCGRGCLGRRAAGRLAPGATVETARAELAALGARLSASYPDTNTGVTIRAASLRDVIVGDVRPALLIMFGAVMMVLLIACANVANLLLVRGRARTSEIAVRATIGADRSRIVRQLLTESMLLALIGGSFGILLAAWGIDVLRSVAPAGLPRVEDVSLDGMTVAFALTLAVATALIFGIVPALHLSRVDLLDTMRQGVRAATGNLRTRLARSSVLIGQVALSVMLLLAAGLMVRSLYQLSRIDAGFDPDRIAIFRLSLPAARYGDPGAVVQFMERTRERLIAVPGMEEVAVVVAPPLSGSNMFGNFARTDRPEPGPGEMPSIDYRVVDENAFAMLNIPIVSGRGFTSADRRGAQPVALLSRSAADRYFPGEDPIGKVIDVTISAGYPEDSPRTIVGVFEDLRSSALTREPQPALYIPFAQSGARFPHVLMRGRGDPALLLTAARQELQTLDAEIPMAQPGLMSDFLDRQFAQPRFYLVLLTVFAFLAVLLAGVGLYGVVAYAVARRTREIGVRMALGARVGQVVQLVLWQGLRPAIAGIAIGLISARISARVMRSLLFGIGSEDPLTFAVVPLLLGLIALLACALPASRASRIPPAVALRSD